MSEITLLPSRIEPQELVYQDRNQKLCRIIARFDGFSKEYYVSDHGQRAAVVAVRNGEVLLTRQYRLLINGLSYEIPGGRVDEKETPKAAACDLPRDIFPRLIESNRLYGFPLSGYRCAMDSPDRLAEARAAIANERCQIRLYRKVLR